MPAAGHASRAQLTPVATVLAPEERTRVDAVGEGVYLAVHRDSVDDVLQDIRDRRVGAVLLSVARCDGPTTARVASMVREFPRVPALALLSRSGEESVHAVLALGSSGVQRLVDVRQPDGWSELRRLLAENRRDEFQRHVVARLAIDLAGVPEDCWRFFEALFLVPPRVSTVRDLARELAVLPSTFMSRFFRAGLPAPKRYLAYARLVRVARLLENPGFSIANVANHLEYSSPQSFGRHVRSLLRISGGEFRRRYDGERMLERFRADLVLPHLPALRGFRPLVVTPPWVTIATRRARARMA